MSLDFTHSIEIERPAAETFAYVADFSNNPAWQNGMRACRWTSDETMVVGATYVQEARFSAESPPTSGANPRGC